MSANKPLPHDAAPLHVQGTARYIDDIPTPANTLHLAFGMSARHVRDVIVGGEVVVRDRQSTRLDAASLKQRAHAGAERLWARMGELPS